MAQRGARGHLIWDLLSVTLLILVTVCQSEDRPAGGHDLIKPVVLPKGTLVSNNEARELSLSDRNPMGFMAKFHACSASDHTEVLLEACVEYQHGFGDHCGIYIIEHAEWFRFQYNYIVLKMLGDFCAVCEEKCSGDHKSMPDICNIQILWMSSYDNFCDTYCDAQKQINVHNLVLKQCGLQQETEYGLPHQSNSCPGAYRDLLLDEEEDDPFATTAEKEALALRCPLVKWWDDWIFDSCEHVAGYPSWNDALADIHSGAWLRCSFDNEEDGDGGGTYSITGALCQDFFQQLTPCDGRGWSTKEEWEEQWRPDATMSPTAVTCQELHTASPVAVAENHRGIPHFIITEAPNKAPNKETEKLYKAPEESNKAVGATTNVISLLLVVGLVGGLVALKRRSSKTTMFGPSSPDLISPPVVHEPLYHQVLEMNELCELSVFTGNQSMGMDNEPPS
eukprot:CAMPEP_0117077828 /NCGR_PEP_ID=MMETSP0472-20121206/54862_1 /TAXON_ID=693140 ORGANISM="Tiarina fusus, Strain LIS" /NCGR_SAMPLE_ID=MMETSP0472 /ASSEMBLY_ACC=CAM_ASM_000603 /LENGTH=450 /DNA_ID=CAMNT_0004804295 /DNA_START=150 /DNA_END=1502 /DNA_ORIENTATION=+